VVDVLVDVVVVVGRDVDVLVDVAWSSGAWSDVLVDVVVVSGCRRAGRSQCSRRERGSSDGRRLSWSSGRVVDVLVAVVVVVGTSRRRVVVARPTPTIQPAETPRRVVAKTRWPMFHGAQVRAASPPRGQARVLSRSNAANPTECGAAADVRRRRSTGAGREGHGVGKSRPAVERARSGWPEFGASGNRPVPVRAELKRTRRVEGRIANVPTAPTETTGTVRMPEDVPAAVTLLHRGRASRELEAAGATAKALDESWRAVVSVWLTDLAPRSGHGHRPAGRCSPWKTFKSASRRTRS